MDRLAKKCVLASGLLHGTLVLVLLVGPAFLRSNETVETKQVIDFIPFKTLQQDITGGGKKTSFLKKCKGDACAGKAVGKDGKPLPGAAKNSFMTKCEKDS